MSENKPKLEYETTAFIVELNGKFLVAYWNVFSWTDNLTHATKFNETLTDLSDFTSKNNDEYKNIIRAKIIPIKEMTTYQLG
jgi:hypothetical protein